MKRVPVLFCLAVYAASFLGARASADAYLNIPNAQNLLEHLVRHSDELLTEVNLTRANQFTIINPVILDVRSQGGWGWGFYSRMLVDPRDQSRIPEYFIGKIVNDFRMQTIMLYDIWWRSRGPNPALSRQFIQTDYAYTNALAATYFFIEALRRSYLIRGAQGRCWSTDVLARRLVKLERLSWELRELMMSVRYASAFHLPIRRVCLEATYRPYRVNVQVNVAQNFIPFPFFYENRFWTINGVQGVPGDRPVMPSYDVGYWNQRWNYIDQSYTNGYQPNLPADYEQRPYTPMQQQPQQPQYQPPQQQPNSGGYPQVRDPLQQPVNPPPGQQQQQPGQPGYPVPGDVAPNNDYNYNG